jgi:hypothetical protein
MRLINLFGNHNQSRKKPVKKFFHPGKPMGWSKNDSQANRRRAALRAHKGDALSTARALQQLANVTQDRETAVKARQDATYFFNLNRTK